MPATADSGPLVEGLFRREAGRLTARLARLFGPGSLDDAEEIVQSAMLKALHVWPRSGVPDNPAAWLWRAARNEALDRVRRRRFTASLSLDDVAEQLADDRAQPDDPRFATELADEKLGLIFACCHPVLPIEARIALTLKSVCGLGTKQIARAFLLTEPTAAQRITRAKATLSEAGVSFAIPAGPDLPERLDAVLAVLYLMLNEGTGSSTGDALIDNELLADTVNLSRLLADHPVTGTPEAEAMAALVCLTVARVPARLGPGGVPVLMPDQDRQAWHRGLIAAGFRHLKASMAGPVESRWHIEAAIAAVHAAAPSWPETDWQRIIDLYDRLVRLAPSPVALLNRAVAIGQRDGPTAGLAALSTLETDRIASRYPLFAIIKSAFVEQLGDRQAAADLLRYALDLAGQTGINEPDRHLLLSRLDRLEK